MNGIISFNDLMRGIEREELKRELLKEWYQHRTKTLFTKTPKASRNN